VKYLLDVNVLVAWGWADHVDHSRVAKWLHRERTNPDSILLTSAIPQLGFVRVSVFRSKGQVSVEEAAATLDGMLKALGDRHQFTSDSQTATSFPSWCRTADKTTDAHLHQLAESLNAKLATLDEGIKRAFLVPR
jgi:hypothetical protein